MKSAATVGNGVLKKASRERRVSSHVDEPPNLDLDRIRKFSETIHAIQHVRPVLLITPTKDVRQSLHTLASRTSYGRRLTFVSRPLPCPEYIAHIDGKFLEPTVRELVNAGFKVEVRGKTPPGFQLPMSLPARLMRFVSLSLRMEVAS